MAQSTTKTMWLVRAGRGAEFVDAFVEQGVVGLCFDDGTKLPSNPTREQILDRVTAASPGEKKAANQVRAAQQARFVIDIQVGDLVLTYDPETRDYLLGEITSGYLFLKDAGTDYCHARRVSWQKRASRAWKPIGRMSPSRSSACPSCESWSSNTTKSSTPPSRSSFHCSACTCQWGDKEILAQLPCTSASGSDSAPRPWDSAPFHPQIASSGTAPNNRCACDRPYSLARRCLMSLVQTTTES